jgi:hypothetical protein
MNPSADDLLATTDRTRLRPAAMLSAIAVAAAGLIWLGLAPGSPTPAAAELPSTGASAVAASTIAAPAAPAASTTRRVYPYAVVPGGVSDRDELARVIGADKVVADHYAGFKVEAAQPVKVA